MKMTRTGLWILAAAVAVLPSLSATAELRVATIQMDKVVRAYPEAQKAEEALKAQKDEFEKEIDKMETKAAEMRTAVEAAVAEAQDKAINESERERRAEAARQKIKGLTEFQSKVRETRVERQKELSDQEMRIFRRVIGKLRDMVSEYAVEQKIDLVLDEAGIGMHGAPMVVHASDALDITDAILKRVAARGAQPAGDKPDVKPVGKKEPAEAVPPDAARGK
jgi:Skp family chaperone for outer membrane proteins